MFSCLCAPLAFVAGVERVGGREEGIKGGGLELFSLPAPLPFRRLPRMHGPHVPSFS